MLVYFIPLVLFYFILSYLSHITRRPVFRYYTIKAANNKGADQTAWISRLICTFVVRILQNQVFSWPGSFVCVPFLLGVWGRMWNWLVSVPDHCLSSTWETGNTYNLFWPYGKDKKISSCLGAIISSGRFQRKEFSHLFFFIFKQHLSKNTRTMKCNLNLTAIDSCTKSLVWKMDLLGFNKLCCIGFGGNVIIQVEVLLQESKTPDINTG